MAFNLKATSLVDRVETTDKVIRETLVPFWAGQIQPTGSTGNISQERARTIETLGRMTKTITGWAVEQLPVRGVVAANEAVATALALEPKVTSWVPSVGGGALPRFLLVEAMSTSKDLLFWTRGKKALANALSQAIRTDPNPYVRAEALRAIGLAPVPVTWVPILIDAIQRTEETIAQSPFSQRERDAIVTGLRNVLGKLQNVAAQAAQLAAQSASWANSPTAEPTVGAEVKVKRLRPPIDWKPWAMVGAAGALAIGAGVWSYRSGLTSG